MKRCDEFQPWFADYLSQALPAPLRHQLEDHLTLCPTCRQNLEAERRLDQLLATQPLAQPPPDFTLQVLARLHREHVPAPSLGSWLLHGLPYAASALALLVGLNRVFGTLPASLWGKVQATIQEGNQSLDILSSKTLEGVSLNLLQGTNPLGALSVLALLTLTLALYLSLAEEH